METDALKLVRAKLRERMNASLMTLPRVLPVTSRSTATCAV
jgi:hypothetical protein